MGKGGCCCHERVFLGQSLFPRFPHFTMSVISFRDRERPLLLPSLGGLLQLSLYSTFSTHSASRTDTFRDSFQLARKESGILFCRCCFISPFSLSHCGRLPWGMGVVWSALLASRMPSRPILRLCLPSTLCLAAFSDVVLVFSASSPPKCVVASGSVRVRLSKVVIMHSRHAVFHSVSGKEKSDEFPGKRTWQSR